MNITTETLTKNTAIHYLDEIVAIELDTSKELGMSYGIPWGKENFVVDLPGKWKFSSVAYIDKKLAGYLIMSKWGNNIHGHRMAMVTGLSGRNRVNLAKGLYEQTKLAAIELGIDTVTAIVPENNLPTQKFYQREGFKLLSDELLNDFIKGRKMDAYFDKNIMIDTIPVEGEPHRSFVFQLKYESDNL